MKYLALFLTFFLIFSCNKKLKPKPPYPFSTIKPSPIPTEYQSSYTIILASETFPSEDEKSRYYKRRSNSGLWVDFKETIIGFNHKKGYEYRVYITQFSNKKGETLRYEMDYIVEKTKKDSDFSQESTKPIFNSTWKVVSFDGKKMGKNAFLRFKPKNLNTSLGYNQMNATYKVNKEIKTLTVGSVLMTKMGSPDNIDNRYSKALNAINNYFVLENKLYLREGESTRIVLKRN